MARLGDIVSIAASTQQIDGEQTWLLNLDMVEQQTGDILSYNFVSKDKLSGSIVQFDTENVLYSKLRPNLNKVVVPNQSGFATSEMLPLRPDISVLTREYLAAYLRSDSFVNWAISKTAGAKMPRLGTKELLNKDIPVPTIDRQTQITGVLERLADMVSLRKQQIAKLDELVKARFVEMFGDCTESVCIGDSGLTISDGNYSDKYPRNEEFVPNGVPFIRANNINGSTISDDNMYYITPQKHAVLLKGHLKKDDILITTRGNIGQVAIVPERHENSNINAQLVLLRVKQKTFLPQYLLWALQTNDVLQQYKNLQTGTALKQLPVGRLAQVAIKRPTIEKQAQFSLFAQYITKSKLTFQQSLDKLEVLKKALMQEYFG